MEFSSALIEATTARANPTAAGSTGPCCGGPIASSAPVLPGAEVYYAVKANPHPAVLAAFAALGSGFEISSTLELDAVLDLGVGGERIICSNPVKRPDFSSRRSRQVSTDSPSTPNRSSRSSVDWHPAAGSTCA